MNKNINNVLISLLAVALLLNMGAMIFYTSTTNSKLSEAISLGEPQSGELILITADNCDECKSLDPLKKYIEEQNIELTEEKLLAQSMPEAQALIEKYEVTKLPTLIFQSEDKIKLPIRKAIEKGSREVDDNALVWEQAGAPYFDLSTEETKGLVEVTYLTDETCNECYDPKAVHGQIISNFGIVATKENEVSVFSEEGQKLTEQYDIENVPTIIMSADVDAYEAIKTIWGQVGTVEEDGTYIFRNIGNIQQTHKNLKTGEIIKF